jgi:hypothetical protein
MQDLINFIYIGWMATNSATMGVGSRILDRTFNLSSLNYYEVFCMIPTLEM